MCFPPSGHHHGSAAFRACRHWPGHPLTRRAKWLSWLAGPRAIAELSLSPTRWRRVSCWACDLGLPRVVRIAALGLNLPTAFGLDLPIRTTPYTSRDRHSGFLYGPASALQAVGPQFNFALTVCRSLCGVGRAAVGCPRMPGGSSTPHSQALRDLAGFTRSPEQRVAQALGLVRIQSRSKSRPCGWPTVRMTTNTYPQCSPWTVAAWLNHDGNR